MNKVYSELFLRKLNLQIIVLLLFVIGIGFLVASKQSEACGFWSSCSPVGGDSWTPSGSGGHWNESGTSVHDCGTLGTCGDSSDSGSSGGGSGGGWGGNYYPPPTPPTPPTNLRSTCSADGTQVTLQWNPSHHAYKNDSNRTNIFSNITNFLTKIAHAGGGGGASSSGGGGFGEDYNNQGWGAGGSSGYKHPITYNLRVGGQNYNGLTSTSHTVSITPDTTYTWSVQSCAGGACSSRTSGTSFSCPSQPQLTLTADDSVVRYNENTTLRWNSQYTNSCQASSGWTGNKSLNGSEPTQNLTSATTFMMQCFGNQNRSVTRAVTVNIQHGEGGKIEPCETMVRRNQEICINYDTGTSEPQYCVVRAGSATIHGPLVQQQGTFNWTITGETDINLYCEEGGHTQSATVRVLPDFQET